MFEVPRTAGGHPRLVILLAVLLAVRGDGGGYDENWPEWYATYLIAEATGAALPD